MAKSTLQELGLKPEAVEPGGSYDDLPEGGGRLQEPLQPGTYRFALPKSLATVWEKIPEAQVPFREASGEVKRTVERIRAVFDDDAPLVIVQSPLGVPERTGEPFLTSLTNIERWRDRDHTRKASDLDYLLKALGETEHPGVNNNAGYVTALMKHPEQQFTADADLTYFCSSRREIYALVQDDKGQVSTQQIKGVFGNDRRLRAGSDVQKDPQTGVYPTEVQMAVEGRHPTTGEITTFTAVVRGFNNLNRIRAN